MSEEELLKHYEENIKSGDGRYSNRKGLTNIEINKIMKPFYEYIGTTTDKDIDKMINHIKLNNILKGCFILNIHYHWVAINYDFEDEYYIEYYDPFGYKYS